MSKKLCEISVDMDEASYEIEEVMHLLNYLHEDMVNEIYQPLKEDKASLIREERIEMMFTLLVTASTKLCSALDMQKEITQSLDEYREKEKVPARAATQAEGQKEINLR